MGYAVPAFGIALILRRGSADVGVATVLGLMVGVVEGIRLATEPDPTSARLLRPGQGRTPASQRP
ncbi:MAG TPA: hypothetical protein VES01_08605 [Dermatophilaceae bacterium]|nr:hypothetical protein [Dermatophilaceae bacterium]